MTLTVEGIAKNTVAGRTAEALQNPAVLAEGKKLATPVGIQAGVELGQLLKGNNKIKPEMAQNFMDAKLGQANAVIDGAAGLVRTNIDTKVGMANEFMNAKKAQTAPITNALGLTA